MPKLIRVGARKGCSLQSPAEEHRAACSSYERMCLSRTLQPARQKQSTTPIAEMLMGRTKGGDISV